MKHFASPDFWSCYHQLPRQVQQLADACYDLLKANPSHPSLRLKKIGKYRAVRVGLHYRALAIEVRQGLLWFWIGSHAEYDRIRGG
ncbi:MAG: hypothetical protein FJ280_26250 [Planctomycetes bacterium]|nr:hypothetical protein [Planctomycetota bacterium]